MEFIGTEYSTGSGETGTLILNLDEWIRGVIRFSADIPQGGSVRVWSATSDNLSDQDDWEGPYTDPSGSVTASPHRTYANLRIQGTPGAIVRQVIWESERGTRVFFPDDQLVLGRDHLVLGRDYGCSCRIVIRPDAFEVDEPRVVLSGPVRIRFWNQGVQGNRAIPEEHGIGQDGKPFVTLKFEDEEVQGDLIELLVTIPGPVTDENKALAKTHAEAAIGLLALLLGDGILGDVVFADQFTSEIGGAEGGELSFGVKFPKVGSPSQGPLFGSIDRHLDYLTGDEPRRRALRLALRWYAKAMGNDNRVDQFIACFVGLEALATAFWAAEKKDDVREEHARLVSFFEKAQPRVDTRLGQQVLDMLSDFPLGIKFREYYRAQVGAETRESKEFGRLRRLRNMLLHGSASTIQPEDTTLALKLLDTLILSELNLTEKHVRGRPSVASVNAALSYELVKGGPSKRITSRAT